VELRRHLDLVTRRCLLLPLLLLCVWTALPARAAAQPLPTLTDPVNDFANVIDAASADALVARIRALHAASGDTIVVATVESIAPYGSIEEYALRLFERAGIGDRETDRGLLVLLAVSERRVRIEVGYGLEEAVTDGFAGDVIRRQMLPAFRNGQFGQGLLAGVTTLARRIAEVRDVQIEGLPAAQATRPQWQGPSVWQIILIIIVIIAVANLGSGGGSSGHVRRRRGPGWHGGVGGFGGGFGGFGGGFGGGGFGGFGGGRSGGGGASGGW
jgi:uncharacterized protein